MSRAKDFSKYIWKYLKNSFEGVVDFLKDFLSNIRGFIFKYIWGNKVAEVFRKILLKDFAGWESLIFVLLVENFLMNVSEHFLDNIWGYFNKYMDGLIGHNRGYLLTNIY